MQKYSTVLDNKTTVHKTYRVAVAAPTRRTGRAAFDSIVDITESIMVGDDQITLQWRPLQKSDLIH